MFQSHLKIIAWEDFRNLCRHRIKEPCICSFALEHYEKHMPCSNDDQSEEAMLVCPLWVQMNNYYTKAQRERYKTAVRSKNGRHFKTEEFEEKHSGNRW